MSDTISSKWILDFEQQIIRGKHVVLYGNIHDQFLRNNAYVSSKRFLIDFFDNKGYEIVVSYDFVDNYLFRKGEDEFNKFAKQTEITQNLGISGSGESTYDQSDPLTLPQNKASISDILGQASRVVLPDIAFTEIRRVLAQTEKSAAIIIDLADMISSDPTRYSSDERKLIVLLKKCILDASYIKQISTRNTLIITASNLKKIPEWLYMDNPRIALVQATKPNRDERHRFIKTFFRSSVSSDGFYDSDAIGDDDTETVFTEFADLTDGFQAWDLEALRKTSNAEKLSVKNIRNLIDYYKFGLRDDPWEQLDKQRVSEAEPCLGKRVIGQHAAVSAITNMLISAKIGISMTPQSGVGGKPKGVFFFVGPTGVGKTELAKAVTEHIFGDEKNFIRFDMSEYKEEHSAEKLAGAPPGFVGYEQGGQLTEKVMEQPYSIILFDEIEKAHPKVLDKFLQILEDGRLTDGKGQTAYFNQSAIIFTSNIGASDFTDDKGNTIRPGIMKKVLANGADSFSYQEVKKHFVDEVEWYFTSKISRAEIFNRLGDNIVVFDILRPTYVEQITNKFLGMMSKSANEKYGYNLNFDESVCSFISKKMSEDENLLYGGRRIKSILETAIERPLNKNLFENDLIEQNKTKDLAVSIDEQGKLNVQLKS